jgi:hypothetical protein
LQAHRYSSDGGPLAIVNAPAITLSHADPHPVLMTLCNRRDVRFDALLVGGASNNDVIGTAGANAMFVQKFAAAAA